MKTPIWCALFLSGLRSFAIASLCVVGTNARAGELPRPAAAVLPAGSADLGALPGSQPLAITLHLAPTPQRTAALQQFLTDVQTPGTATYHQWMTPAEFGTKFGATEQQIDAVRAYASLNGLAVEGISASRLRVMLSGPVAGVERAFAPALHGVQIAGSVYYANAAAPVIPDTLSGSVVAIDGLSTLPEAHLFMVAAGGDSLSLLATAVESNALRVLALSGDACLEDVSEATRMAAQNVLRQAAAQGMTVLAASGCAGRGSAAFPASLSEVLAVAVAPGVAPNLSAGLSELRPVWQEASGLPGDGFRHEPDVTVTSLDSLARGLNAILLTKPAGNDGQAARVGNINAVLYRNSPTGGVFSQPDGAVAGTWEAATGLGLLDIARLGGYFPNTGNLSTATQVHATGSGAHGQTVTVNATVTDTTGANGTPTGSVALTSNPGGVNVSLPLSGGLSSSYTGNTLPAGTYTFTGVYSGDASYAPSQGSTTFTIQTEDTALTASVTGSATFGSTFHVTVTARSPSGVDTPSGSINITVFGSSATVPSQPLTQTSPGTATAAFDIPASQAGTLTLGVSCSSTNASFTCNTPYQLAVTVAKANPTVSTLTVSPTTPVYGTPTSFTETFTGPAGYAQPSGYSQVSEGSQYVVGGNLAGGTYTGSSSTVSGTVNHTFTASFPGDNNYNAASATATTSGTKIATTLVITAPSVTTVVTGGQVTLNATLTLASFPTGLNATGTVQFFVNGAQIGQSQTIYGTSATIALTLPFVTLQTIGTDTITATYSGDTNYAGSTSTNNPAITITVGPATAITLVSSATNTVPFGGSVMVTATVAATPTSGSTQPTGTLTFTLSGASLTTAVTMTGTLAPTSTTAATATATFTGLAAGSYSIAATCATVNFACANVTSNAVTVTVGKAATTTTLTANPPNPAAGASVLLNATVTQTTPVSGFTAPTFTGSVQFYDNGAFLGGPVAISAAGVATMAATLAGAGDTVTAVYSGDPNYLTSTGTLATTTTTPVTTSGVLTSNVTKALAGSQIILTLTVSAMPTTSTPTPASPTGAVMFYDVYNGQTIPLGSGTLVSAGPSLSIAQFVTTGLLVGTHSLTAVYGGTAAYVGSTSNVVVLNLTDYSVAFTPGTLTLNRGSVGSATVTVTSLNGFTGQVVLGCTPPSGTATTCSFNPAVISGSGNSQLTITTTVAQANRVVEHAGAGGFGRGLLGASLGLMLLGLGLPAVRRRRVALLAVMLSCLVLSSVGCTNLVNGPAASAPVGGTPLGTQLFSITTSGTDGVTTTRHNVQFQVTVQ